MKNKDYRSSKMKYQLAEMSEKRVKSVIWKLNREQREFVEGLGYQTEEYLYMITTRPFKTISLIKSSLLKTIHFKNKNGKKTFLTTLNEEEKAILSEYGIKYIPYKFKILLYPKQG